MFSQVAGLPHMKQMHSVKTCFANSTPILQGQRFESALFPDFKYSLNTWWLVIPWVLQKDGAKLPRPSQSFNIGKRRCVHLPSLWAYHSHFSRVFSFHNWRPSAKVTMFPLLTRVFPVFSTLSRWPQYGLPILCTVARLQISLQCTGLGVLWLPAR